MLNLIKSFITTFISVCIAVIGFLKGPMLIGLLVGGGLMYFSTSAEASTIYTAYSCNLYSCPLWMGAEGSIEMLVLVFVIIILFTLFMYIKQ